MESKQQLGEPIELQYRRDKVNRAYRLLRQSLEAMAECYDEDLKGHWKEIEKAQALEGHLGHQARELRRRARGAGQW